jgi:hypothetical protein
MVTMSARPLMRFRQLTGERRRLLLRAACVLSAASAVVALFPFRRSIRFGSIPLGRARPSLATDCVWAVEIVARRLPWRAMCIEKGLAVQRMLRSSGVDAVLHYGARLSLQMRQLEAHVWVTVDGHTIIGGEEADDFAPIAVYPEPSHG